LALSVTDQVNTQLGQGLDLNGDVGAALYNQLNDSSLTALRVRAFSTNNTGPGFDIQPTLNITNSSVLTTSDYRLEYDGANYSARRLSDGAAMTVTVTTPLPAVFPETLTFVDPKGKDQGFSVVIDTGAAANDKFLLQPTRSGAAGIKAVLDQPDELAFAAPLRAQGNLQNRGTGLIAQPAISNTQSPLVPADLQAFSPMTLTYDAASGNLLFPTPLPVGVTVTPATLAVVAGQSNTLSYSITSGTSTLNITQAFSGSPQDGDTFTLGFNTGGVSDNRNGLNLVNLQSKATVGVDPSFPGSSGVNFSDGYGDLVGRVGSLTAQARQDSDATSTILKQATNNRDSLSAVNLDEEAANMIKFEQYYNASAQIIKVAQSLFDTLINTFR
jgi:flagellar hook-associated protein 1